MSRKVQFILLFIYSFTFSILKTIRFPNGWAKAHWLLDYRFGFIKRGFSGEVFSLFFEKNEFNIRLVSAFILAALYIVIFYIAVKQTQKSKGNIYDVLFYVIFFLSQYIVLSAYIIGYMELHIFLITVFAVLLVKSGKYFLASILLLICLLIHEIAVFISLPICFFAIIIEKIPVSDESFSLDKNFIIDVLKKSAILLTLPIIFMIGLSFYQELYSVNHRKELFNYLMQFTFVKDYISELVARSYTETFRYYLSTESRYFFIRMFSKCAVFFGIPILYLLFIVYKKYASKLNIYLFFILVIVTLSPLLLNMIAWDTYRIWSYPYASIFLIFWILNSKFNTEDFSGKPSPWVIIFFIICVLLLSLRKTPLFDREVERFSLTERIIISLPIILGGIYYVKTSKKKSSGD